MIKTVHIFHDNTNVSGDGIDYKISNKNGDSCMSVSCGDLNETPTATEATLTFYGKAKGSQEFVQISAIKTSDYTLVKTGTINESYFVDLTPYVEIRVALSNADGNVTVVGEVVE